MADHDRSRVVRCVALAAIVLVVVALLFPIADGLSVARFFGDKTYLLILQDNSEIRGTGGLTTVMGLVTMHDGNIASLQYYYGGSPQLQALVQSRHRFHRQGIVALRQAPFPMRQPA